MSLKVQIIIGIGIVFALLFIFNMIKKNKLELKYALSWIFVAVGILIFDLFPAIMVWTSKLIGIDTPVNMLFFFGFCFALMIVFSLSVALSRLSFRVKRLAQELAILRKELESGKEEEVHDKEMDLMKMK